MLASTNKQLMAYVQSDSLPEQWFVSPPNSPLWVICCGSIFFIQPRKLLRLKTLHLVLLCHYTERTRSKAAVLLVDGVRLSREIRPGYLFSFMDNESMGVVHSEIPVIPARDNSRHLDVLYIAYSAPGRGARFRSASIIFICAFSDNVPASVRTLHNSARTTNNMLRRLWESPPLCILWLSRT